MSVVDVASDSPAPSRRSPGRDADPLEPVPFGSKRSEQKGPAQAVDTGAFPDRSDGSIRSANALASLTVQQRRVIELLAEGLLNKQIAHRMGISASTVKAHISAAYRALGVNGRVGAVLLLARHGQAG